MRGMKRVALAATVAMAGAGIVLAPPVLAKKNDDAQANAPQPPKLSDVTRKFAIAAQTAIAAKDWAAAKTAIDSMEAASKTDEERYIAAKLRLGAAQAQLKDTPNADQQALAAPLEALIANPHTPKDELGRFAYYRGALAYDAQQYAKAAELFTRARDNGYNEGDLTLQLARAKMESGDIDGGAAELQRAIAAEKAAGRQAPETWYRYAISKYNSAKNQAKTLAWLTDFAKAYPTPQNWRLVIIVTGFDGDAYNRFDKRQRVDLFRLMRAAKALADKNDYKEYAQTAVDLGYPAEAKAVLDEGRANGKLPATDTAGTMLLQDSAAKLKTEAPLAVQEKQAAAAKTGDASAALGDVYLGMGDYAKAITLYKAAMAKGVARADEVSTHHGIALALSGDKAGARTAFASVKSAPRTDIAALWTTWLDSTGA